MQEYNKSIKYSFLYIYKILYKLEYFNKHTNKVILRYLIRNTKKSIVIILNSKNIEQISNSSIRNQRNL